MDSGYLSLALGLLLSVSEILPYIKSIQGNGIINFLQTFITKQREIGSNLLERMESEQLIESQNFQSEPNNLTLELINTLKDLSKNLSKDLSKDLCKINQNKFTLKTPDEYQLINIENSLINNFSKNLEFNDISDNNCEILRSLSYKIDYNANKDTYLVHW